MKRFILAAALTASLALGACATTGTAPGAPVLGQTLADDKALLAATAGLYGANVAASAAVDLGALKAGSPQAVRVADLLAQAKGALDVGRAAYAAGNASGYLAQMAAVQSTVAQAWALIPAKEKPK